MLCTTHGVGIRNITWTCKRGRWYVRLMGWRYNNLPWPCKRGRCYKTHGMGGVYINVNSWTCSCGRRYFTYWVGVGGMCQDGEDESPPWKWIQVQLTASGNARKIAPSLNSLFGNHEVSPNFATCSTMRRHRGGNTQVQIWWQWRDKMSTNSSSMYLDKKQFRDDRVYI